MDNLNLLEPFDDLVVNSSDKNLLAVAILDALEQIRKDLGLSQLQLCKLIHIPTSLYSQWKNKGKVKIADKIGWHEFGCLEFIDLYNSVSDLLVEAEKVKAWYSTDLGDGTTPIQRLTENARSTLSLNEYVNSLT